MRNKKLAVKLICLVVMIAIVAPLAASCKKADPVSAAAREHVYSAEYFDMPEDYQGFNATVVIGDMMYAVVYSYAENSYAQKILAFNTTTGEHSLLPFELKETYTEKSNSSAYVNSMQADGNGNLMLMINRYSSSLDELTQSWTYEDFYEIVTLDASTGAEIMKVDLSTLKEGMPPDSYFYISRAAVSGDKIIAVSDSKIFVLDGATGKKAFEVDISSGWVQNMFTVGDRVLISMYEYTQTSSTYSMKEIDFAARSLKDSDVQLDGAIYNYNFLGSVGDNLYMYDTVSLYRYSLATGEKTELLNWIDSDIDSGNISSISVINENELICTGYNYESGKTELTRLTKVAPEDVVEKTVLTMAVNYLSYEVRRAVIAFNKTNEKFRIRINDYSQYNTTDNYNAGIEKLNADIIAGNVPDVLYIDSYNMPVDNFISKGILADMYALMDKDPDFNRNDYLQNVFEAFSRDGKLYTITPSFNIYTVTGKAKDVGTKMGWTMDDLNALMATKPEGTMSFANTSRDTILYMSTYMAMDTFIDRNTGKCSFDDGSFAQLLDFARTFPSQEEINAGYEGRAVAVSSSSRAMPMPAEEYISDEQRIRNGSAVLQMAYVYDYNDYQTKKFIYDDEPIFIGFPTSSGIGSVIMANSEFALYAKSKNLDGGWEFIKYFLTDEHQKSVTYSIPVKISRLNEIAEEAKKPYSYTWTDETGKEHVETYPRTYWIDGQSVELPDMTQADIDKVNELIYSVNTVMRYDTNVQSIITEEAEVFFSGQRDAQATAQIIQRRVQTYISESR